MPPKHKAGGCTCCGVPCHPTCVWYSEDFSSITLYDEYTDEVHSNAWSIVSEVLETSDGTGQLTYDTANPHGVSGFVMSAKVKCDTASDQVGIMAAWTSSVDYVAARLTVGGDCGTLEVIEDGSVLGECAVAATEDTWYKLHLCYHEADPSGSPGEGPMTAVLYDTSDNELGRIETYAASATGTKVGVLSGTCTGTVYVDDLSVATTEIVASATDCLITIAGWDDVSGAWTLAGALHTTTADNALKVTTTTQPDNEVSHYVKCLIKSTSDGDEIRIILGYEDTDNYAVVQVTVGTDSTMSVWSRESGSDGTPVELALESDLSTGTYYDLEACLCNGYLRGRIEDQEVLGRSAVNGKKVGIGTGDINGTVSFNDPKWHKHISQGKTTCPGCTDYLCPQCSDPGCTYFTDYFDRDTGLGCEWDVAAGSAVIANDKLRVTGTNARVMSNSTQPEDMPDHLIATEVTFQKGDVIRLYLCWESATDYYYAELTATDNPTLDIIQVAAGSPATIASSSRVSLVPDGTNTVHMSAGYCNGSDIYAMVSTDPFGQICNASTSPTTGDSYCGVGTGAINSVVEFSYVVADVTEWINGDTCTICGFLPSCCGGRTGPAVLQLDGAPGTLFLSISMPLWDCRWHINYQDGSLVYDIWVRYLGTVDGYSVTEQVHDLSSGTITTNVSQTTPSFTTLTFCDQQNWGTTSDSLWTAGWPGYNAT